MFNAKYSLLAYACVAMILFAQGGKKYPKNALNGCFAGFRRLDSQNFSRR